MFHTNPPTPTKPKRVVNLIASTVLGLLLSFLVYTIGEIKYLSCFFGNNTSSMFWYIGCAVFPGLRTALFIIGAGGGFFLGKFWWQKVYIEQVWWRKSGNLK